MRKVYKVIYQKRAYAFLNSSSIKDSLKEKIVTSFDKLSLDISRVQEAKNLDIKKLKGNLYLFRLRVGTFRAVFTIKNEIITIEVIDIDQRKDIYRG